MIDLAGKPFGLNQEKQDWVFRTLESLTPEEKLGQIFVDLSYGDYDETFVKERLERTKAGGLRYMSLTANEMLEHNRMYQKHSKIPLLIAANIEAGGNGACKDGTNVGCEVKVAAAGDGKSAYELGYIGAVEAKAVGCSWAYTPIVDLSLNWRNPIISTRTWSDRVETVIACSRECLKGIHDGGLAATAKHFPGDGVDERDHHFSSTVNTMSAEEWDESFGRIYREMIDGGVEAVMAGHIMLPAYQKKLNPGVKDSEILPASLCRELLTGLLREQLGFNGLILTDASHMAGFTSRMSRRDGLAAAINAGCDMILFFNHVEEDFAYLSQAVSDGRLSPERIDEAVTRVLALKASRGLDEGVCLDGNVDVVACKEHRAAAAFISRKAITLAKQVGETPFPITVEKYKKIMIMPVHTQTSEFAKFVGALGGAQKIGEDLKEELNRLGFEAELFVSPLDKTGDNPKNAYDYKESIEKFKRTYDLVLTLANCGSFSVTQRLNWDTPKGGFEVPWYVYDVPTIFISFNCPFHLADVPAVKTMINCYDSQDSTIHALVEKLTGREAFTGKSPVDVFCGFMDTRL